MPRSLPPAVADRGLVRPKFSSVFWFALVVALLGGLLSIGLSRDRVKQRYPVVRDYRIAISGTVTTQKSTLSRRCLELTSNRSFDLSRTQQLARLARLPDHRRKMAKSKYP